MQKTWVWSLSQENRLEKEMATHSSILAWNTAWNSCLENHMDRGAWWATPNEVAKSQTQLSD